MLKPVAEHPLLPVVGLTIGVVGLIFAYVFYRRSLRERKPRYAIFSNTLVQDLSSKLPELRITYDGAPQERVTVATIFFWNDGREAIRQADIASTDPVRIEIGEGAEILSARINYMTNKACDAILARPVNSPRTAMLSVAFLDRNDGVSVTLVHNGKDKHPVEIKGTVIGGKIELLVLTGNNRPKGWGWSFVESGLLFFYIFVLLYVPFVWMLPEPRVLADGTRVQGLSNFGLLISFVLFLAVLGAIFITLRVVVKLWPRVPEKLWIFS
jgi:hypothetical protein